MMACSCGGARSLAVPRALTAGDDPRYPSLENLIDPRTVRGRANLSVSVSGGTKTNPFLRYFASYARSRVVHRRPRSVL